VQHKILLKFAKSCTNHSTYFKNVRKQSVNIYLKPDYLLMGASGEQYESLVIMFHVISLNPDYLLMGASGEQYESLVIMFHNTSESILLSF